MSAEPEILEKPLPDLAQVPAEDRDRVWFENYYQKNTPQLTIRAVVTGGLLGMIMSISNLYTTLKLGWSFGVAITACVISFTIWNAIYAAGLTKSKMTMLENNAMQSTASAAGYSTGGTMATAVGAMLLISGDGERLPFWTVGAWVFLVAMLGVFLAIPMKRQMINQEQLPFPSGIAAAETLRSLYAEGEESVEKSRALIDSMIVGGIWGVLRSFGVIPDTLPFHGVLKPLKFGFWSAPFGLRLPGIVYTKNQTIPLDGTGMAFEPSMLMIAAGMIVGMRVSVSMLFGSILNYVVVTPMVAGRPDFVAPDKVFFGDLEAVLADDGSPVSVKVTRWSLWFGTALMVMSGLTSFALSWRTILRAFTSLLQKQAPSAVEQEMAAIEVPNFWLVLGIVPITIGMVAVCWFSLHISPVLTVISVVLSFAIALVAARATGETDTTPVGAMGKITQLIFAVLSPKDIATNLMSAGTTAGAAGSSADLLTDLKSGYLLGANPRQQFIAQFSGVFFGTLSVVPAWYLMVPNRATLEHFNSPATTMWFAVANALSEGVGSIPPSARVAIVIGALLGVTMPLVEHLFPKSRSFLPSSMGLGLAFVVPFQNSLSFFLGSVIAWRWEAQNPKSAEKYVVPVASGVVAGESLAAAAFAMMNSLGVVLPG